MPRVTNDDRRRQLIDAAVAILIEEGPPALTARAIAARAGAPVGTVHYAFRDLDELLGLAASEVMATGWTAIGEIGTGGGVRATIAEILRRYCGWLRTAPEHALACFEIYVSTLRSGWGADRVAETHAVLVALLTAAERSDHLPSRTPIPQLAHLVMMATDGLALIHFGRHDRAETPADVDALIAALQAII